METAIETKPAQNEAPGHAKISLANLKQALKTVGMAIERTATIPVLQCVRMEQVEDGLALESTNLDLYIRTVVAELGGPEKPILIPAAKFTAWAKLLDGEDVKITTTALRATVQCGRAKAVLPILSAAGWPDTTATNIKGDGISLVQGQFARALKFALIAMSVEESRYTLNGIKAEGDGTSLRLIATDGHKLMAYTMPCGEKIDVLLPGRFVKTLVPLLTDEDGGLDLTMNDKSILATIFADNKLLVASNKLAGTFPQWQAIMPKDKRTTVTIKVADLLPSLERALLMSGEYTALDLRFAQQLTVSAADANAGEATETVECTGGPADELHMRINGSYLLGLIKLLDSAATVDFGLPKDNMKPMLLKATPCEGETLDYIIMPMAIK